MIAIQAAKKIVRALEKRRKVYNFPWQTTLLMKITSWMPDWVIARALKDYKTAGSPPVP